MRVGRVFHSVSVRLDEICFPTQISSFELIRNVLLDKKDSFSGRPRMVKVEGYLPIDGDVTVSSTSPIWKLKKKAMVTSLKM